jgi:hypothetical protein
MFSLLILGKCNDENLVLFENNVPSETCNRYLDARTDYGGSVSLASSQCLNAFSLANYVTNLKLSK